MRSSNHRILAFSAYLQSNNRIVYIGLVCVINVCTVHNTYIALYRCTYYHASDRIKILSAWRQIWNESHAIKFYIYSNILLCYNRKWDKYRFFSDSYVCCKLQANSTERNIEKKRPQIHVTHEWEQLQHSFLCDQIIISRSDASYAHTLPSKLIYLTQCRFVHVRTIAIHTRTQSLALSCVLVKWVELICLYCPMKWREFSQLKCDENRAKAVKCAKKRKKKRNQALWWGSEREGIKIRMTIELDPTNGKRR